MERLLEDISFSAERQQGTAIAIDAAYVDGKLKDLARSEDLARYVL
jgi:ATP-dependent HslUV protease ATP-binding subunit HslU